MCDLNDVALIRTLVMAVVDRPEQVLVALVEPQEGEADCARVVVRAGGGQAGLVIGRQGRMAEAIRAIVQVSAMRDKRRILVDILAAGCDQEGCWQSGWAYYLYAHSEAEPIGFYCAKHAFANGFCVGCGQFWGGVERFDFGGGLCENCKDDCADEDRYANDEADIF